MACGCQGSTPRQGAAGSTTPARQRQERPRTSVRNGDDGFKWNGPRRREQPSAK